MGLTFTTRLIPPPETFTILAKNQIDSLFVPPTNGTYQFYSRGNDGNAIYVSGDGPTTPTQPPCSRFAADNQDLHPARRVGVTASPM